MEVRLELCSNEPQSCCRNWCIVLCIGELDYRSKVYNVTVDAEETSAVVSIAIFDDSIVEVNETVTADLSVPVAEAALGVSVSATDGTAYVEIQDDGKQNPLHMHVIVCSPWSPPVFIQTWLTSHSVTCPTR